MFSLAGGRFDPIGPVAGSGGALTFLGFLLLRIEGEQGTLGAQVSGIGGAAGAAPYPSPNSLSVSLEISAGSSIPNRPIAMTFSATSCVMGSSRSFRRSARSVCS